MRPTENTALPFLLLMAATTFASGCSSDSPSRTGTGGGVGGRGGGGHAGVGAGGGQSGGAPSGGSAGSGAAGTGGSGGQAGSSGSGAASGSSSGGAGGGGIAGSSGTGGSAGSAGSSGSAGTSGSGGSSGSAGTSGAGGSGGATTARCDFSETFSLPDGSAWPAPWVAAGGISTADIQGGRGRLVPVISGYSLARMYAPLTGDCQDVEANLRFEFSSGSRQGIGLYLRQNGGYLTQSNPAGQGYGSFAEAFRSPNGLGLWREIGGNEQLIGNVEAGSISPGVVYQMRYQVDQTSSGTTTLRSKIWPAAASEPGAWTLSRDESSAALQNVQGGVVLDAWSTAGGPAVDLFIDDLVVSALP